MRYSVEKRQCQQLKCLAKDDREARHVAARAAHAHFTERTGAFELMPFVTDAVKQETMNHIRIFGSERRA